MRSPAAMFVAVTTIAIADPMQKARGMPGFSISPSTAGVGSTCRSVGRSRDLRISDPVIAAAPMHCSKKKWIVTRRGGCRVLALLAGADQLGRLQSSEDKV